MVDGKPLLKDHGYVFEVDPVEPGRQPRPQPGPADVPRPLRPRGGRGRPVRRTRSTSPRTPASPNGLYYRWTPPAGFAGGKGALRALAQSPGGATAGSLQAMRCLARQPARRRTCPRPPGPARATRWSGSTCPTATARDGLGPQAAHRRPGHPQPQARGPVVGRRRRLLRRQLRAQRRRQRQRARRAGLVLRPGQRVGHPHDDLRPSTRTRPSEGDYDGPDNITVSPYGGVILAEDGEGVQHLVGVTEQGKAYPLARNELNDSEFTGPTFSADGTDPVRLHPVPRHRVRHHRSVGAAQQRCLSAGHATRCGRA